MAEWAATFGATFEEGEDLKADFGEVQKVSTSNYEELFNKPQINGVELKGNKSFEELGEENISNIAIANIFNRVFGGN